MEPHGHDTCARIMGESGELQNTFEHNDQHISKPMNLTSCSLPTALSRSRSGSSFDTELTLKSLDTFERIRHLYVVGNSFPLLVEQLKKSTTIQFEQIEYSKECVAINFKSPVSSKLICRINEKCSLKLKLYASKQITLAKRFKELAQRSFTSMEDFDDSEQNERDMEEMASSASSCPLSHKQLSEQHIFHTGQDVFKCDLYEQNLFYEMSSLLFKNVSWGLGELYNHLIGTYATDTKLMTTAALLFSTRKKLFSQILDGRQFALTSPSPVLAQQQPQLFSFIQPGQPVAFADKSMELEPMQQPITMAAVAAAESTRSTTAADSFVLQSMDDQSSMHAVPQFGAVGDNYRSQGILAKYIHPDNIRSQLEKHCQRIQLGAQKRQNQLTSRSQSPLSSPVLKPTKSTLTTTTTAAATTTTTTTANISQQQQQQQQNNLSQLP